MLLLLLLLASFVSVVAAAADVAAVAAAVVVAAAAIAAAAGTGIKYQRKRKKTDWKCIFTSSILIFVSAKLLLSLINIYQNKTHHFSNQLLHNKTNSNTFKL